MKKILLLFFALWGALTSMAQAQTSDAEKNVALQFVSANRAAIGLSTDDLNNLSVASTYIDRAANGLRMIYLQQTYKDIPVYNYTRVLAFKDNKMISNEGGFFPMAKLAKDKSAAPSLTPEVAIQAALTDRGLVAKTPANFIGKKANGKLEFGKMGVSRSNVTTELMWVPSLDGKSVQLGWEVYIEQITSPDIWRVRVDAANGRVLDISNLTVYCNWDDPNHKFMANHTHIAPPTTEGTTVVPTTPLFDFKTVGNSPSVVNAASYRVVAIPAESPIHPGGAPSLVTDPWNAAPGNATSLKWHSNPTDFNYTRGNNVFAYQDRANDNTGTPADGATSTTALPTLTFDFVPDFTVAPTQTTPVPNQQFNITNLFYFNNVMHDILYIHGFDEINRNFQDDNQGRGGNGNDHVNAEAQDGGGTNNANFGTPADGGSGRMQMYLWNGSPQKDGDVDNGIIAHEFGHGISNRLTGTTAGCLGNAEQMGEGWGDYNCLMLTQNWATSNLNTGFNSPRGIGTYALGQPITGIGIRSQKYCTDFTVNNKVYAVSIPAAPHDRGEIWAATLWDMTWNIINQVGFISPTMYDLAGGGGNVIAFRIVNEGMKLQQCNPGFISGRNAIIAADQALYGGAHVCAIREAFRRRGMGANASEGSTQSVTDQIPDFTLGGQLTLTQAGMTQVSEGGTIVYTNTINSLCATLANYVLTDTLPSNVTYVAGSATNGGTLVGNVVKWTVNQAPGTTQTYSFSVTVNAGSYFPPTNLIDEQVTGAGIPASWTATTTVPGGGNLWTVVNTASHSAPNSFFALNEVIATDKRLATNTGIALGLNPPAFSFWHKYNTEDGWDGGVVEISTNGGGTWTDLGANMIQNPYNGSLGAGVGNNLANRSAFTGVAASFIQTKINLAPYANQTALFRFRFGSDDNTAGTGTPTGWWVDDVLLRSMAVVNMRSSLHNASNVRVNVSDTVTEILPPAAGCPIVTTQPAATTVCNNSTAVFTASVAGVGMTHQWEMSTTGVGGPWSAVPAGAPYTGQATMVLTINPAVLAMNGYAYRLKTTTAACPAGVVSAPAILTVVAASVGGTVNPPSTNVCGTTNSGTLTLSGQTGNVVRWEFSTTSAAGPWAPTVPANTATTHNFTNLTTTTWFRAVVAVNGCVEAPSSVAVVNFSAANSLTIIADPGTTLCAGDPTKLTVVETSPPTPVGTLYAQTGAAGNSPVSQNFEAANDAFDNQAAEDFVVPAGATWTITQVSAGGLYFNGPGPSASYNVTIFNNSASNKPGTAIATYNNVAYVGGASPVMTIPATALTAGTYWISIQSNLNFTPGGEWAWGATGASDIGFPWAWQNPAGGFGTPCTTWGNGATSCIPGSGRNLIFNLTGTSITAAGPPVGGTYLWSPAAGLSSTTSNPVAASPAVTTTYTVNHNNGAGCIRQASITITVNQRPAVTTPPSNVTVCAGQTATFTAVTSGTGTSVKWQLSTTGAGGPWTDVPNAAPYSGVTTNTLIINPVSQAMNGNRYRIAVTGICPPDAFSTGGILTVNALPVVTITPNPTCGGVAGIYGTLLTASSPTGGNFIWTPATGLYIDPNAISPYVGGTPTATVYAAPTVNTVYTVSATNGTTGCVGTGTVTVNYTPVAPTVTPPSATICLGQVQPLSITSSLAPVTTTFSSGPISVAVPDNTANGASHTINVAGVPAGALISAMDITLNMSHSYPGDMIFNLKAPNTNILNLYKYNGGTFTGTVSLTPASGWYNAVVRSSSTTAFSLVPTPYRYGIDVPTGPYKADILNATVPGQAVQNPTGFVSAATSFTDLYSTPNGPWVLAMADGGAGDLGTLTSWSITMTYGVPPGGIWSPTTGLYTNPAGTTPYIAGTPAQTVYASPTVSTTYSVTVANGTCTSPARTVPVTVNQPIAITSQPTNVAVCTNNVATFTVGVTGSAIAHHWRVSTNNGNTWADVANGGVYSGATTATLTITAPPVSMSGYFYKDSMSTAPCAGAISAIVRLTVNPLPIVTLTAIPYSNLLPGMTTVLTTTVVPNPAATFTWYRDGVIVPGASASTLAIDIDGLGLYQVSVTDVNGCTSLSNTKLIGDSASGRVFIYPNPNSGKFQVRYYSTLYNAALPRGLNIYDDKGARVLVQKYSINAPYGRMDVDMRKYSTGTYWVEVVDANGNRLAVGRVLILR